jgi:hypothetical protein
MDKKIVYGAVQWIKKDMPILDGMPAFETKEKCLEYINQHLSIPGVSKWTIVKIEIQI